MKKYLLLLLTVVLFSCSKQVSVIPSEFGEDISSVRYTKERNSYVYYLGNTTYNGIEYNSCTATVNNENKIDVITYSTADGNKEASNVEWYYTLFNQLEQYFNEEAGEPTFYQKDTREEGELFNAYHYRWEKDGITIVLFLNEFDYKNQINITFRKDVSE